MTSDDPWQVGTAIVRLRRAADLVNPASALPFIVSVIGECTAIVRDFPGDPDAVDAQAAAFHALAGDLASISTGAGRIPDVWEGPAAAAATASLKATRDLMERASVAMRTAGGLLDDHAETLRRLEKELGRHRDDLAEARRELDISLDISRYSIGRLVGQIAKAFLAIRGAMAVFERLREADDLLRRGMREVEGKARAGAIRCAHVTAFDAVRLAGSGDGILTTAQLKRAADRLDSLSIRNRSLIQPLLDGAASDAEKAYLLKALAAGHPVGDIERFAALIHGKDPSLLRQQLSLVSPGDSGLVSYEGSIIRQFDGTTCGSASIMVARAMNDPLYALSLTTDGNGNRLGANGFDERIKAEEQRIHDSTNKVWPQRLGTTPWGLTAELNRHGTQYDWRAVDDTSVGSVNAALDDAVGAVDAGHTVPVLIGDGIPQHYVLLIGHEGSNLVFYNPSGEVVRVSESDFRDGNMSALGYRHVQGVVTPR